MKRQNLIVSARELRAARNLTRWLASGCNWAESPSKHATQRWARAQLGDVRAMLALYRLALSLSDGYAVTQSCVGAAADALEHGDWVWANQLQESRA